MKLITLHRILVSTAIAFCAWFVYQESRAWRERGSHVALALAALFALVAVVLTWYLTNLKRFVRIDPPSPRGEA